MEQIIIGSVLGAGVIALIFALYLTTTVLRQDKGNERMQEIQRAIREGAIAFLNREYRTVAVVLIVVAAVIGIFIHPLAAAAYVFGAICSGATGIMGMRIAVAANARTAASAMRSLNLALRVAFASGAVMGLSVVGVGLLGLTISYLVFQKPEIFAAFGMGASSIALFARVGGGIFTKAADVGADIVGKVEAGIPEDDPRNPAVIADNVGDNVGDVAGMGADLYESYVGSMIATMALAAGTAALSQTLFPLAVAGAGIVASIIGTFFVRTGERADPGLLLRALRQGVWGASVLVAVFIYGVTVWLGMPMGVYWAVLAGLVAGVLIGVSVEYYTSAAYSPTRQIAQASLTGAGTTIIAGMANGMFSTLLPSLFVVVTVLVAYNFAGLYGVAISAVGMLSTLGITLATDAYGPVADNAGGIAEQAHLPPEVRERTDALDSLGNTTAATGKGFAIGSAVLTALGLIAAYGDAAGLRLEQMSLLNAYVLSGLLLGALLPFVFCAFTMGAVGRAAYGVVNEVRRQWREIPGLMEGTARPEYARCVDISTSTALREMMAPGLMAVIVPVAVGLILGKAALGALLVGATASGFLLAVTMANAGGSWDNAKKYIEGGHLRDEHGHPIGKGTATHAAAVVGDTVGDPFKDTSGPSLNILIKLMSIVALVFAPIFGGGLFVP